MPLRPPLNISCRAVALPAGHARGSAAAGIAAAQSPAAASATTVALHVSITADTGCGIVLHTAALAPQYGLSLVGCGATAAGLLPFRLEPGASASLGFVLRKGGGRGDARKGGGEAGAAAAALAGDMVAEGLCALQLTYSLLTQPAAAAIAAHSSSSSSISSASYRGSRQVWPPLLGAGPELYAGELPAPPRLPLAGDEGSLAGSASSGTGAGTGGADAAACNGTSSSTAEPSDSGRGGNSSGTSAAASGQGSPPACGSRAITTAPDSSADRLAGGVGVPTPGPSGGLLTGSSPLLSHRHVFVLEFPEVGSAQQTLRARLLGPLHAKLGQPVALTWHLTRTAPPSQQQQQVQGQRPGSAGEDPGGGAHGMDDEAEVFYYEVGGSSTGAASGSGSGGGSGSSDSASGSGRQGPAVGSSANGSAVGGGAVGGGPTMASAVAAGTAAAAVGAWHPRLGGRGSVRLGRRAGSMATVEAVVLPLAPGRQPAPALHLRSVGSGGGGSHLVQEEGAAYVMVAP